MDASEIFFLEDGVVLVEGQEDVIFYKRILEQLAQELPGEFFGWGVGGKNKMRIVSRMLVDLGFERVVGILDGNAGAEKEELQALFPQYHFESHSNARC